MFYLNYMCYMVHCFMCIASVLKYFVKCPSGSQPVLLTLWIPIEISKNISF